MHSPSYIDRHLQHLDTQTIIDTEQLQHTNYLLDDGSRLKVTYRDGYSIGFTLYHSHPFNTALKSLEPLGFLKWEVTNEEILPYSHSWDFVTNEGKKLKIYAMRDADFECWTFTQAFVISRLE